MLAGLRDEDIADDFVRFQAVSPFVLFRAVSSGFTPFHSVSSGFNVIQAASLSYSTNMLTRCYTLTRSKCSEEHLDKDGTHHKRW